MRLPMIHTRLFVLSLTLVLTSCSEAPLLENSDVPKVKVADLKGDIEGDSLYFPAVANAAERSHLSFRVAGEISKINVKEGDKLKKGDVIAELDPTDYQLDVDNASARYTVVNNQYQRSRPLVNKGLLAKSQFDEIAARRQIALAELKLAKLRLSFTRLLAPVDGVISRVNVDRFENIQVGQQIVNIHSLERVEVILQLPDRLYVTQPDQSNLSKIEVQVRVPSGNNYEAAVQEFTTEPDPATGTFTVTLSLPMPEDEYILDGMAVEVTSKTEHATLGFDEGVRVPIEAIFNGDGDDVDRAQKYVWVVESDSTVRKSKVEIGKATQLAVQVLSGLSVNQQVVIAGISKLRDGMKVDVIETEATHE